MSIRLFSLRKVAANPKYFSKYINQNKYVNEIVRVACHDKLNGVQNYYNYYKIKQSFVLRITLLPNNDHSVRFEITTHQKYYEPSE